ncbi:hypothetical protein EVAR_25918_1 [Eumeta japonica]|uniref:Uncharacterized protein n=1 Tax=Eumeta variegata TaxID=151549 RepID=A0A4C1W3U1_EUMVA|nr:hypothetical protein EVAR_25918_1 [Eumeta japonica]
MRSEPQELSLIGRKAAAEAATSWPGAAPAVRDIDLKLPARRTRPRGRLTARRDAAVRARPPLSRAIGETKRVKSSRSQAVITAPYRYCP